MYLSTMFGVVLSVALLSTSVFGDANHCLIMEELVCETRANSMLGSFNCNFENNGKTTELSITIPIDDEIPPEVMLWMTVIINGQEPMDVEMSLCDCLDDKTIGEGFVNAIVPEFAPTCPIPKRTLSAQKWKPSLQPLPSGVDGRMSGTGSIGINPDDPMVKFTFKGNLNHGFQCTN